MCVLAILDVFHPAHDGVFYDFFHLRPNFIHKYLTALFFLQVIGELFLEKHIPFDMSTCKASCIYVTFKQIIHMQISNLRIIS